MNQPSSDLPDNVVPAVDDDTSRPRPDHVTDIEGTDEPVVDETSGEIQGVLSMLNRVRAQPESERLMFSGSSITDLRTSVNAYDNTDIPLPDRIGRFKIERRLGEGGYGQVLLAQDPRLNRHIALKIPRAETLLTIDLRTRFLKEAEAAAALSHPNIVPVFEAGRDGPIYFIASKYCSGKSLAQWLKHQTISTPPQLAARAIAVLSGAIQHAHDRGVLHRDMKPSNVLIEETGANDPPDAGTETLKTETLSTEFDPDRLRVTDFGLASIDGTEQEATRTGAILGTPSYMSPEQADGRRELVGRGTDIYSLGVMLYELLTGTTPFRSDNVLDTLQAVRHQEPTPPRRLQADIPRDLEAICLKCLEKRPADRYETASLLQIDLERFLNGRPVLARPITNTERVLRWTRRNPVVSVLSALSLLLMIGVAVGSTAAAVFWAQAQQSTLDKLEAEVKAKDEITRNEELAIRALFEARLAESNARRRSGEPQARGAALESVRKAAQHIERLNLDEADQTHIRNEAIAALALVDLRMEQKWAGHAPRSGYLRIGFDADINRYARLEPDGDVVVRNVRDNTEVIRVPGLGTLEQRPYTVFSPDDRYLAIRGNDTEGNLRLHVWDIRLKPHQRVLDVEVAGNHGQKSVDFSRSGLLAYTDPTQGIVLFDLTKNETASAIKTPGHVAWLRFDPSGTRIASAVNGANSELTVWDISTGNVVAPKLPHRSMMHSGAWHPNGRFFATGCRDARGYVWNVETGQLLSSFAHENSIRHLAFNHQGNLLMSTGWDSTTRLWDPLSGRQLLKTIERGVSFSRDDRWLGFALPGIMVGRWAVSGSDEFFTLGGHERTRWVMDMAFSPDNRLLATVATLDGLRIWDVKSRRQVAHLEYDVSSVQFSADGTYLLTGGRSDGVLRFPLQDSHRNGHRRIRIGPPQRFAMKGGVSRTNPSFSADGSRVAINLTNDSLTVFDINSSNEVGAAESRMLPGRSPRNHAVMPDGRFVIMGNYMGKGTSVWNAETGDRIAELNREGTTNVSVSPDGNWAATTTIDECVIWRTDTWKPAWQIPHADYSYSEAGFSGDGQLVAITCANSVQLVELSDGKVVAELPASEGLQGRPVCFSPNARYLAVGTFKRVIQIWDLAQVRQSLSNLSLAWNQPGLPKAAQGGVPELAITADLTVNVERESAIRLDASERTKERQASLLKLDELTHHLDSRPGEVQSLLDRGDLQTKLEFFEDAILDYTRVIELAETPNQRAAARFGRGRAWSRFEQPNYEDVLGDLRASLAAMPDNSKCQQLLAWMLVTAPDELQDPMTAEKLAKSIVQSDKRNWHALTTLGLAQLRQGHHEAAIATLPKAHRVADFPAPIHLLFLAEAFAPSSEEQLNLHFNAALEWWSLLDGDQPDWQTSEFDRLTAEVRDVVGDRLVLEEFALPGKNSLSQGARHMRNSRQQILQQPNDYRGYHERGRGLAQLNKKSASFLDADIVVEMEPELNHGYYWRGFSQFVRYRFKEAIADLEKSIELKPLDQYPLRQLAWIYATGPNSLRDHDRAIELARRAIAIAPKSIVGRDTLAAATMRKGEFKAALSILKQTDREDPRNGPRKFLLAICEHQLENTWAAQQHLMRGDASHMVFTIPRQRSVLRAEAAEQLDNPKLSASSNYGRGFEVEQTFDGFSDTRWNSENGDTRGAWVAVTWDKPRQVGEVVIREAFDRITGFRIQKPGTEPNSWEDIFVAEGDKFKELRGDKPFPFYNDKSANPVFQVPLPERAVVRGIRVLFTSTVKMETGQSISVWDVECH